MMLPTPCAPFSRIKTFGDIAIDVTGKTLIMSTGNDTLPLFNEKTLNPNRLTIAESPFGGVKGSYPPDYEVGTVSLNTGDGVSLTDTYGNNSSVLLSAGKLKELGLLTVDTSAKTTTIEFILKNTSLSNSAYTLNTCDTVTSWSGDAYGTLTLDTTNKQEGAGCISSTCSTAGDMGVTYNPAGTINLSTYSFLTMWVKGPTGKTIKPTLQNGTNYIYWTITANGSWQKLVLPLKKPTGSSGTLNLSTVDYIKVFLISAAVSDVLLVDDIKGDVAKSAYVEITTPDILADTSAVLQYWTGSQYETATICKLDAGFTLVSATTTKAKFLDGTLLNDVYGSGNGRSVFPKGVYGYTTVGSLAGSSITYSTNKGAKYRIGIRVDLPPSDNGRTAFNQVRLKILLYYSDENKATDILPDISGNGNNGIMSMVGLANDDLGRPNSAMKFDGVNSIIDCGSASSLDITGAISICIRFYPTDLTIAWQSLIAKGVTGATYNLQLTTNQIKNQFYNGTTWIGSNLPVTLSQNTWYHMVYQYDPASSAIINYINTTKYTQSNITTSPTSTAGVSCCIGGLKSGGQKFKGIIKDVKIYNRVLSQDEVTADYNGQLVSSTGLVGQWKSKTVQNMGRASYIFEDSSNTSYGLQNMIKSWLAVYDPTTNFIDFYLFTHRPKNLEIKINDTGSIYEVDLHPGNGIIYHGNFQYPDLTLDSDSNLIPNCLETSVEGSIMKFLKCYGMVID